MLRKWYVLCGGNYPYFLKRLKIHWWFGIQYYRSKAAHEPVFLIFQSNRLFGGLPKHCHNRKRINYTWIRDLNPATLSTCYSVWKDSGHKKYHISITLESKSMSLLLPTLGNAVQDRVWINEGFFPVFSHLNCRLLAWAKFDSTRDLFEQILGPPTQVQQKFLSFNEVIQDVVAKMSRKFVRSSDFGFPTIFSDVLPQKKGAWFKCGT